MPGRPRGWRSKRVIWHIFLCSLPAKCERAWGSSGWRSTRERRRLMRAHLLWPWAAAKCKGVNPFSCDTSAGDPKDSSSFTHSDGERERTQDDDDAEARLLYAVKINCNGRCTCKEAELTKHNKYGLKHHKNYQNSSGNVHFYRLYSLSCCHGY